MAAEDVNSISSRILSPNAPGELDFVFPPAVLSLGALGRALLPYRRPFVALLFQGLERSMLPSRPGGHPPAHVASMSAELWPK